MAKSTTKKQKTKEVDWTSLDKIESINSFVDKVTDKPEQFVDADSKLVESIQQNLKFLYDLSKETEKKQMGPLKQLLIKGFDETQIWEEIQSQNRPLLKHLSEHINDLVLQFEQKQSDFNLLTTQQLELQRKKEELDALNSLIKKKASKLLKPTEDDLADDDSLENGEAEQNGEEDDDDDLDDDDDNEEDENEDGEDKFFKLDDMEKFVQQAEDEEMMADEDDDKDINDLLLGEEDDEEGLDDINLEDEDEDENEEEGAFGNEDELDEEDLELEEALEKRARGLKEFMDNEDQDEFDEDGFNSRDMENEDEDEQGEDMDEDQEELDEDDKEAADEGFWNVGKKKSKDENRKKSEFEQKQAKIKEKIRGIEKDLVAEKPWMLIGEASAADRPTNSLLEATLDFEYATKLAPVVTEEYTNEIEEVIRKRIAESLFDDVLRKLPQESKPFKPSVELDMEKSKLGLAEVYEQEYMEKVMGAQKEDKLSETHEEIDQLFNRVCKKLDALANFHFTPKRAEIDIKVKTNVPSIRMEEAVPVSVSESTVLAPREIYTPENASLKNESELTQEDRKKNRKQKKAVKKKERAEKEASEKLKKKLHPEEQQTNAKKDREQALRMIKDQRNTTIASKDSTGTGSSTSLFKKLQEEADKKVSSVKGEQPKEKKKDNKSSTAFKM